MLRDGLILLAIGIAGFCALLIYDASMKHVWHPLDIPLQLSAMEMRTPTFKVKPGYYYTVTISVNPSVTTPHADCLLGVGTRGIYGDCKGHGTALVLSYVVRSGRGSTLASGKYPRQETSFSYTDKLVEATIASFRASNVSNAFIELHYRRSPRALAPLHPYLEVFAPEEFESAAQREALIALPLIAVGGLGALMLLLVLISRFRRKSP